MSVCLAVTCHDPAGAFTRGIQSSGATVAAVFDALAVNATAETARTTMEALAAAVPGMRRREHGAGTIGIGTARRHALALALEAGTTHVAYSDLDHVLRWASTDERELSEAMTPPEGVDLVVVGRSPAAFAREPRRLQATESVVNHAAALVMGRDPQDSWDFMIATRVMTREVAQLVVDESGEESIANDVAWPLLAHRRGRVVAYRGVEGMAYRFRDDFDAQDDARDDDPVEWIRRLEIAARHATAMRPYV